MEIYLEADGEILEQVSKGDGCSDLVGSWFLFCDYAYK